VSGTWGAPVLPPGRDNFTGRQLPDVRPVDDLSRFVMDRIIATEAEPNSEVPQAYNEPAGPMAHRYAAAVRADMVAFRQIVAQYCEAHAIPLDIGLDLGRKLQALKAVQAIANRFADHPDFRDEWRLA